jgi:hypothetical protein
VTANDNAGCGFEEKKSTYGEAFNNNCDGVSIDPLHPAGKAASDRPAIGWVYAMELRDAGNRVWMFTRDDIHNDISNSSNTPDPSSLGEALADFPNTHCDIGSHFKTQSIIANVDICGGLAEACITRIYFTVLEHA